MVGISEKKSPQPTEMTILWRNHIDYLPDRTRNGQMGPGLAGQMFLFGPGMYPADANGKLVVAIYDETPRPAGQPASEPAWWEFSMESLRSLVMMDERFGVCYGLFLPWPKYSPDIKNIRIAARFEPEEGYELYAKESRITIDLSPMGSRPQLEWKSHLVPRDQYLAEEEAVRNAIRRQQMGTAGAVVPALPPGGAAPPTSPSRGEVRNVVSPSSTGFGAPSTPLPPR
jgi:hypothetical protein